MSRGEDSAFVDDVDRRIIAALQLNGRAPWGVIARSAGTSESTAQRRFHSLHERGLLHVVAVADLNRTDAGSSMLVRIQARPGRAWDLAQALAGRPEARFVAVVTGTADLIVDFVAADNDELFRLLFTDLPGAELMASTESVAVIRIFTSAQYWDTGLLSDAAVRELRSTKGAAHDRSDWDSEPVVLPELERAIVDELARDGRMPMSELARTLDRSESTVSRALHKLIAEANLRFRTLVEPELLGFEAEFMLWLSIDPGRLEAAGRQLGEHPGSKFLAAATGRFNLVGQMVLPRKTDLFRYTDDVIGKLPGLSASDVTLHLATLKRAWVRVDRSPVEPA